MNYCKVIPTLLSFFVATLWLSSCSPTDPSPFGAVEVTFAATGNTSFTSGRPAHGERTEAVIEITDFQLSIRDIELEMEMEEDSLSDEDSTEVEVEFAGPYIIDLLDDTDVLTQSLGSVDIPSGTYHEVEMVLHKSRDVSSNHVLYDRSIYVAGTIDGTPFVMWHDTSEELEVEYPNGVVVDDAGAGITIAFSIDQFMNSLHQIDLSQAVDGNGDGLIEIHPNDDDGNKELADLLKENIKEAADLLED